MTIHANGQQLTTDHVYRTANARNLPKWQRNRGVIFKRTAPGGVAGFSGEVAVVQVVGTRQEFLIPADLLSRVN
jgi:hypothetical protein